MTEKDDKYVGLHIFWIEEWSQLFTKCNWYTFNFLNIELEDDRIMGGVEVTVIMLGLGVRVRWNYKVTKDVSSIKEQVDKINAGKFTGVETEDQWIETAWYLNGESVSKETYYKHHNPES